jgi:gamma-glutamyltranspeptidase
VSASLGGVATPHAQATQAGYEQLAAGGTAVDAALAAAAVLAVVLPNQCSIGGDIIAAVQTNDGVKVVNGSGRAGSGGGSDTPAQIPTYGALAVTVPGVVDAWHTLAHLGGRLPLSQVIAPAIQLAAEGFGISPGLARAIAGEHSRVREDSGLAALFLDEAGAPRTAGSLLVQPRLASVLEGIALDGPESFYRGSPARSIATLVAELGGFLTHEDFAQHASTVEEPLSTTWRGTTFWTSAPPTQGIGLLQVLDAMTTLEADGASPTVVDELLPGLMLGISLDRDRLIGADRSRQELVDTLLDARGIRDLIARAQRGPAELRKGSVKPTGDTVAIVAMDSDGGAATVIQSVFHAFGSGILDPDTGVVLQNRGASFTTEPGPNQFRAGQRPMHTLMPVLVSDDRGVFGAHGTMGGKAQPQIHVQLARTLAAGRTAQETVDAPRFVVGDLTGESDPWLVLAEPGVDPDILSGAVQTGFTVVPMVRGDDFGHAQIVRRSTDGTFDVGTDTRADGAAPPE